MEIINVEACVTEDGTGRSDGAYTLIGTWTPEQLRAELLRTLNGGWGLDGAAAPVTLSIHVRRA